MSKEQTKRRDYDDQTIDLLIKNPAVVKFLYRKYVDPNPVIGTMQMVSELSRKLK